MANCVHFTEAQYIFTNLPLPLPPFSRILQKIDKYDIIFIKKLTIIINFYITLANQ